jgi:hypothetical protein
VFDPFGKKRRRAEELERLIDEDLDAAASRLVSLRSGLRATDTARLEDVVRRRLAAREHVTYLSKALAEGTISATAAYELLETYDDAGYVTRDQLDMLRRHAFEAHRREILALLADPSATRFDYFRAIDAYRAAGYLSDREIATLEQLLDVKLNPAMAARRLFAEAMTTVDVALQEERLQRYLVEFEGFPDYADTASHYIALRVHQVWDDLPGVRYAREATRMIHELNNVLQAYLPYTSDLGEAVPIERIVHEFYAMAGDFKPLPDVEEPITERHLNRRVVVVDKRPGEPGSYESERNGFVAIGAPGRVKAVGGDRVVVAHQHRGFPYSQTWSFEAFAGTKFTRLQRGAPVAVWAQSEVGLLENSKPSPVFVHQFREAVKAMAALLEGHRTDHSPAVLPAQGLADRPRSE